MHIMLTTKLTSKLGLQTANRNYCSVAISSISVTLQGCHGWQGPHGLGLVWILQNRKWRRQRRHAADVVANVEALPAKNWP